MGTVADHPLDFVERACQRTAAGVHQDLTRGIFTLAIIARIAPWIGVLGTCIGIVTAFIGISGDAFSNFLAEICALAQALSWSALGVAVALLAAWIHRLLSAQLDGLDVEMRIATADLCSALGLQLRVSYSQMHSQDV